MNLKKILLLISLLSSLIANAQVNEASLSLRKEKAEVAKNIASSPVNAATLAGNRIVAVGVRGGIALSDDNGFTWVQAKDVPTRSTLTSVSFVDAKTGWAAGHNGVILKTIDGGDSWIQQRWDSSIDQPIFGIKFIDADHGIAVGLWSLILKTSDGGKNWIPVKLPTPPAGAKKDLNFFQIFGEAKNLFVSAEGGWVLHSTDDGSIWSYQNVGTKASLWTGVANKTSVWVGGLLGKVFESTDSGKTWKSVDAGMRASVTSIRANGKEIYLVGLDGNVSVSEDGGIKFNHKQRSDRISLTDVVQVDQKSWQFFSTLGVVDH